MTGSSKYKTLRWLTIIAVGILFLSWCGMAVMLMLTLLQ